MYKVRHPEYEHLLDAVNANLFVGSLVLWYHHPNLLESQCQRVSSYMVLYMIQPIANLAALQLENIANLFYLEIGREGIRQELILW